MHQSGARRLVTDKGRVIVTDKKTIDEVVDAWRARYERIFAAEAKARRNWAVLRKPMPSPDVIEKEIEDRQAEWDAYVAEQLADLETARAR